MDLRSAIPPASPGSPVSAAAFNALRDALIRLTEPRGGAGVLLSAGGGSITLGGRARDPEFFLLARITAVFTDGDPEPVVDSVTYTAQAVGRGEETRLVGVTPRYGRLFADTARIVPAAVGDYCYIVRSLGVDGSGRQTVTADLEVLTEKLIGRACVGAGAGAGAGMAAMARLPVPEPIEPDPIPSVAASGTANTTSESGVIS
jgi:hypothetical protein